MSAPEGDGPEAGTPFVIDAAVAVKLVLPEEFSSRAQDLIESACTAGRRVIGPPLLSIEVANAIYAQRRNDEISGGEADAAMSAFLRLGIESLAPAGLDRAAFAFSRAHRLRSVHTAYYVTLSQMLSTQLWTADRALFKYASSIAPWVCWIGDFSGE